MALVSIPGTSRRLGSHVARRLFDGSFWLDQTVLSVNNTMPRAGLRAGRPSRQLLSSCCILPLNVQLDGGRTCRAWIESMEGGHCSNLFELASGNKGAWPARSVSRAMRATPSKSRTWADMPPTFLRARTEALASADSQTALRGRTDFFRLYYSGY